MHANDLRYSKPKRFASAQKDHLQTKSTVNFTVGLDIILAASVCLMMMCLVRVCLWDGGAGGFAYFNVVTQLKPP